MYFVFYTYLCTVQLLTHHYTQQRLTRDVGGDFGQRRLSEPLGGSGSDRHQVGGPRMQTGEHVVGLVPQLGHRTAGTWHVDTRV